MTSKLVELYERGAITADHLVVECLNRLDPAHPDLVLDALPDEILDRMWQFTRQYRPAGMVTNYGVLPAVDQVLSARNWIEKAKRSPRLDRVVSVAGA